MTPLLAPPVGNASRGLRAAGLALALLLPACGSTTGPGPLGEEDVRLGQARARWRSQGFTDYEYQFRRICFCVPAPTARILVRGGRVVSVVATDTGAPVDPSAYGGFVPTVEDLFALIQDAIDENVAQLEVSYDSALAYPTHIAIDRDFRVADEELTVEASNLQPLR